MTDQYHHGDLKADLIQKGVHLLAKEGYEGFSLRKLAVLCNVSHAAPYKHFKSKEELIYAISENISVEFSDALRGSLERHAGDAKKQIVEVCKQYIRFLTENPDYFRFVFMVDHGRPIDLSTLNIKSSNPLFIALQAAKDYFDPAGDRGYLQQFLTVWSMIHGYTLLLVNHTIKMEDDFLKTAENMLINVFG